jgi:3-phosphoshikimate 1-carboxyvinyltransferase
LPGLRPHGAGLQGDTQFAEVLERAGLRVSRRGDGLSVEYRAGDPRKGQEQDFGGFSDTFLTFAALSPLLSGRTKISGIAHTRKQETDRVAGMARELTRLGQEVEETEDTLEITPRPLRADQTIETYHDHRFAMSFGILGCHDLRGDGRPWLNISNPACCAKTFPHFFELLESIRQRSVQA